MLTEKKGSILTIIIVTFIEAIYSVSYQLLLLYSFIFYRMQPWAAERHDRADSRPARCAASTGKAEAERGDGSNSMNLLIYIYIYCIYILSTVNLVLFMYLFLLPFPCTSFLTLALSSLHGRYCLMRYPSPLEPWFMSCSMISFRRHAMGKGVGITSAPFFLFYFSITSYIVFIFRSFYFILFSLFFFLNNLC